jgi:hypothetical protein
MFTSLSPLSSRRVAPEYIAPSMPFTTLHFRLTMTANGPRSLSNELELDLREFASLRVADDFDLALSNDDESLPS